MVALLASASLGQLRRHFCDQQTTSRSRISPASSTLELSVSMPVPRFNFLFVHTLRSTNSAASVLPKWAVRLALITRLLTLRCVLTSNTITSHAYSNSSFRVSGIPLPSRWVSQVPTQVRPWPHGHPCMLRVYDSEEPQQHLRLTCCCTWPSLFTQQGRRT